MARRPIGKIEEEAFFRASQLVEPVKREPGEYGMAGAFFMGIGIAVFGGFAGIDINAAPIPLMLALAIGFFVPWKWARDKEARFDEAFLLEKSLVEAEFKNNDNDL